MTDSKHIVIAGGGTGGHLFPGVAVVEALEAMHGDRVRFTFVGSSRGIEARAVPKLGYDLRLLDVRPLKSGGIPGLLRGAASLPLAGGQALKYLFELRPDLVVAVGGYAAGPFTAAAALRGIPTALMEQNALPGLTNQWLGKLVDDAFVAFESSCEHFPKPRCHAMGNPIRRALREAAESFRYEAPEAGGPFAILVIGGSGGAHSLNVGVPAALKDLPEELQRRLRVVHQAGRGRSASAVTAYEGFLGECEVVEFIDDMPAAYGACDLLVCRAGMSTIAEVTVLGIPALYVPLATGDAHQEANALEIAEAGGGVMIPDVEIGSERATRLIQGLMNNPESLAQLARQAKTLGRPEAAAEIASTLSKRVSLG